MKASKKWSALVLAVMMLLLCACGSNNAAADETKKEETKTEAPAETEKTDAEQPEENTEEETTEPAETGSDTTAAPAEFDGKLHGPFVMTTCGQSTGSVMFHMVAVQAGQTSVDEHQLLEKEMDTVAAGAKTLVITTGTSGKGMGAAGTDIDAEIERCTAVAQKAKDMGMTVVCAHVEGMSRRTDANDQASIDAILPLADVIVCVKDSDSDGLFSNYASEHNIPIIIVDDTLGRGEYME